MSVHDAVLEYRTRLVAAIEASPNKRAACAAAGIHPSVFYRWRKAPGPVVGVVSWVELELQRRVVAAALARPDAGPRRLRDLLSIEGVVLSPSRVWRILRRHRLNTRRLRYQLLTQQHSPVSIAVAPRAAEHIGRLDASLPGDLIQMDCFHVGSFKETRLGATKHHPGQIWQYTGIDVASSWTWAELHVTPHNPSPAITSALAHRIAADLSGWGWTWTAATTDNGNEYRAEDFRATLNRLGVDHRFIRAGRPQTNGKVERVQGTLLEEFYQPTLLGYVEPSITGLRLDLDRYLHHYNHRRPHWGRWNHGQTPAQIMIPNPKLHP